MAALRWFGGRNEPGGDATVPKGARRLSTRSSVVWAAGAWPEAEARTAAVGDRQVTVFGPCSATERALHRLAARGVTDAVLSAFAGSYTVVESTPAATTVFTDPGHGQPIYVVATRTGVLWGSSARALAALSGAPPDLAWLATWLLLPEQPRLLTGRSPFTGVLAVPPGSCLTLRPGVRPRVRTVWQPPEADADLDDGAQRLRAALAAAVAVRIDASDRPSADCSGGLDSTSLTLLAVAQLGDRRKLHAVTVHPAGTHRGGDLDYARAALTAQPQVTHLLCSLGTEHLPYSRMTDLMPATDEPAPGTVTIARAVAEFDLLRPVGSDCHLTGDGGDTLLGGHPAYLADLAASGRLGTLARHAIGWARLRRSPVWPLLAEATRDATRRRGSRRPWPAWSTATACSLVSDVLSAAGDAAPVSRTAATAVLVDAIQAVGRTARCDVQLAEHYGVQVHNPFLDPPVITAALTVPAWLRASPLRYKPMLSTALAGLLPDTVADRNTKGDFTADHYLGLRANTDALHDLANGMLAKHGLIDAQQVRRQLVRAAAGLPVAFSEFEPVLAAEVWLRGLRGYPPVARWPEATPGTTPGVPA